MKTADFDYNLPEELIAQTPLKDRASSRLLVLKNGAYEDHIFSDIIEFLNPGDALVLNETKVLPARIIGTKKDTGGVAELLLLKDLGNDIWECLARPQKRLKPGTEIVFGLNGSENCPLKAEVTEILDEGITRVKFIYEGIFLEILERLGTMPLPPYIHEQLQDQSRYQTVYAKNLGSAAAPTAGLHFTPELLEKIEEKGIKIVRITLHVGLGTFRPVQVDDVKNHVMHTEAYEVSKKSADDLNHIKKTGGRIIAVGTTTVRTLETVMKKYGRFEGCVGETSIFIYPGFEFLAVDAMITNFHLPKSTLLMLVSAFAGKDFIMKAYAHAVKEKYRFFSFGDAMFIEGKNYES